MWTSFAKFEVTISIAFLATIVLYYIVSTVYDAPRFNPLVCQHNSPVTGLLILPKAPFSLDAAVTKAVEVEES